MKKQIPVIRLAVALSVLWLVGCGVVLLLELSRFPWQPRLVLPEKPAFLIFFESKQIGSVLVRHPGLGELRFPSTMKRTEIENELERLSPKPPKHVTSILELSRDDFEKFIRNLGPVEWDVPEPKPRYFYSITFDGPQFLRIAMFPAVAIFVAVLAVGFGMRWVVRGFKT